MSAPPNRTAALWEDFIRCLKDQDLISSAALETQSCYLLTKIAVSRPLFLILDDNFYYQSMRYEVYQLARKCNSNIFFSYTQTFVCISKSLPFLEFNWIGKLVLIYLILKARCSALQMLFLAAARIICLICLCHILEKNSAPVILWFNIVFRFIRLLPAFFRLSSRDLFTEEWPEMPGTACRDHSPDGKKDREAQPGEKCLGT